MVSTGHPTNLMGRVLGVVTAAIVLYAIIVALSGWRERGLEIASFPLTHVPLLILLSLANYWLRFLRWELYLRRLQVKLPRRESLAVFFATFVMVITPAKLGEAFKAGILRERHQVPLSVGLPVILVERLLDLLAIFALMAIGAIFWTGPLTELTTAMLVACMLPLLLVALRSSRVQGWLVQRAGKTPYLQRHQLALEGALQSFSRLLGGTTQVSALLLSILAWACECVSLWIVCAALNAPVGFLDACFIYAASMLVGSMTFLPGGLVGTEGAMIWLLSGRDIASGMAVTIALIVRLATLWLAVAIGVAVFATCRRIFLVARTPADSR